MVAVIALAVDRVRVRRSNSRPPTGHRLSPSLSGRSRPRPRRSAGSITFTVSNTGTQIHEFVVVKTDLKADALAVVDNKIDESVLTPVDEIEDIAVGANPRLTVDLAAGHYVLLCNIESHYEQGMRADFDVK